MDPQLSPSTTPDPAWEMVRRWPGLRAENKLAWMYLWNRSRGGRLQIDVTGAEIAADQGTSSDAGLSRIKNLKAAGLIVVRRSDRQTGVRTIELPHPFDVSRARKIEWDGQFEFEFMESPSLEEGDSVLERHEPHSRAVETSTACAPARDIDMDVRRFSVAGTEEPPLAPQMLTEEPRSAPEEPRPAPRNRTEEPRLATEEPPEVPRCAPVQDACAPARAFSPSKPSVENSSLPSVPSKLLSKDLRNLWGSAEGGAVADEPTEEPRSQISWSSIDPTLIAHLVTHIRYRVRDDRLRKQPCVTAAKHLLVGNITEAELESVLENTARRHYRCPPSAYFNAAMKKLYIRSGLLSEDLS